MRPTWLETMMDVAHVLAVRATCPRLAVGTVIVNRDRQILSTGYNGSPRGLPHCTDVGCQMIDEHCQRAVHAEMNAIVQGAYNGVSLFDCILVTTHSPCLLCAKLIIQAGIDEVVYHNQYGDFSAVYDLLRSAGIPMVRISHVAS